MKKSILSVFFYMLFIATLAQTTVITYSKSQRFDSEVPENKAKFSRTVVTGADGTVSTTDRNLKTNEVIGQFARRNDEPVGVWITQRPFGGYEKIDFDFNLVYEETSCTNDGFSEKINKFFESDPTINYTAPAFGEYETFYAFISRNLRYPAKARREGIEGSVFFKFNISADGTVRDIVITKGVHVVLDKEAMRVLRKMKLSSPPKVNGEPRAICVQVPIKFKLAQ